jgi:hypothetical protein
MLLACAANHVVVPRVEEDGRHGRLDVQPRALDFWDMQPGFSRSLPLEVRNVGDVALGLRDAAVVDNPDQVFAFDVVVDVTLAVDAVETWYLRATLPEGDAGDLREGALRIRTDDPLTPSLLVPLRISSGSDPGDTGDDAP